MHVDPEVVRLLRDPSSYRHGTEEPEEHETHISRVFVVGDWAYKLKKAVDLGFLDYSTPALRRRCAEREILLNRRLAPTVYQDVVSVRRIGGELLLAEPGDTRGEEVDCLVRMRRVRPEQLLDHLIATGAVRRAHVDRLVERLARFYAEAPPVVPSDDEGTVGVLRRTLEQNFASTLSMVEELVSRERFEAVRSAQLSFLTLHAHLFRQRDLDGRVRDGHGDLRSEHVAFLPECAVLDCIEFNDEFRIIDVAADIAFLVMELEFQGAPALARYLVDRFEAVSGDGGMRGVLSLYTSYRAWVRGKVDGIRLEQTAQNDPERPRIARRARRYFELAYFHTLSLARPLLVGVGGASGAGKSTLAAGLAERLGAPVLRSDEVRKELAGRPPQEGGIDVRDGGLYGVEAGRRTYTELADRARRILEAGGTVIVDATFRRRVDRERIRGAAHDAGAEVQLLECAVDEATASRRIERRQREGQDPSDATVDVRAAQLASWEEPEPGEVIAVDGAGPPAAVLARALDALVGSRQDDGARV